MREGWREGERCTCSHTPLPWGEGTEGRVTPGPSADYPNPLPHLPVQPPEELWIQGTVREGGAASAQACPPELSSFLARPLPSEPYLCWSWRSQTSNLVPELTDFMDK